MDSNEWHYELPHELVAQVPLEDRASSRLLVYDRSSGEITHRRFSDITSFLQPLDCLVVNKSRVISARLQGRKAETGGMIEVFILRHMGGNRFEVLLRPKRKVRVGKDIEFARGLNGRLIERSGKLGEDIFEFTPRADVDLFEAIEDAGEVPLPPYITTDLKEPERYQTVYAERPGSVAAPTAGLHFTDELLSEIDEMGVLIAKLNLDVGWATFSKITDDEIQRGVLHPEEVEIDEECVDAVQRAVQAGGRVYAVGTTSVRALEASAGIHAGLRSMRGTIDLFIQPGFEFKVVDRMITNFHLPGTSLLMLVAAFMGRDALFEAYEEAVRERYRFYSFGDAMLIL